jgi:hypothetical protein
MWEAIAGVSSAITLVAFLAALVAAAYHRRILQRERLVKFAPQEDRGPLIDSILDRVSVQTKRLTREQTYDLATRLIEQRSHRFKMIAIGIGMLAVMAAVVAALTFSRQQPKERTLATFPTPFPFATGWVFLGYHDSMSWVEGPMTRIVHWSTEGRRAFQASDSKVALDAVRDLLEGDSKISRRLSEDVERLSVPSGAQVRFEEDLVRFRHQVEEESPDGIPALGDVLRVSKARKVVIPYFRTKGMQYQMVFPGSVKGLITADDETGVQLDVGSLLIVRDVKLGAYPGRPAAVWCRVAACDHGIPQCDQALETERR